LAYPRYRLVGSDEEKDWTLDISPVLLEDDALFQCQVGAADGVKPIRYIVLQSSQSDSP
jgi:hypothetical protein